MRALAEAGDRAGALEYYRQHVAALQRELGLPADACVAALAESLRVRPPVTVPELPRVTAPRTPELDIPALGVPGRALGAVAPAAASLPALAPPRALPWVPYAVPLLVALLIAGAARVASPARGLGTVDDSPARLAVLPFETLGDPQARELGRGFDALLASGLDGLEEFRVVPTVAPGQAVPATSSAASNLARRSGARFYVTGRLVADHDRLRVTASLRDRGNSDLEVGRAEAEMERTELFGLADEVARELMADRLRGPGERLARAAATTTRSLPALKAYLEGERELREARYTGASDAFAQAVRADPEFALAYYRLGIAADRAGDADRALWAAGLAARFSERLSEHDRRLVTAYLAARRGSLDEAERMYRGILADYPEDSETWLQLGELLVHGNPLRGRSGREAREPFERALALDSTSGGALMYLARIASLEDRPIQADSLLRSAGAMSPLATLDIAGVRAFTLNDRPGGERAMRDLLGQPSLIPTGLASEAAVNLDDLLGTARFADRLVAAQGTCEIQALGHRMLGQVAMAQGRLRAADAELARAVACDAGAALELEALMAVQPFVRIDRPRLAALAATLRYQPDSTLDASARTYYGGLVTLSLGDTLAGLRASRALLGTADSTTEGDLARTFGHSLRARVLLAGGQPAEALQELEAADWERTARLSVAEVSDRFLRAELLHLLGRDDDAIGWYGSIAERASYELVYLAPAELRLGRIYEGRGESDQAARHYQRFMELWAQPDSELQAVVEDAARRAAQATGGARN
jgi:tetratricopeptide (TPR) repeat protein